MNRFGNKRRHGYIYVIQWKEWIKIGFSANPRHRIESLRCSNTVIPGLSLNGIEVRHSIWLSRDQQPQFTKIGMVAAWSMSERRIHASLKKYRVMGEWFIDCPEVRAVIDSLHLMPIPEPRWRRRRKQTQSEIETNIAPGS